MTLETELKRTFDELAERLHAEVERQVRAAIAELPARPAGAESEKSPSSVAAGEQVTGVTGDQRTLDGRIVEAIRLMDESRSLSDVLDALTTGAASGGGTVAVLLRRGGRWQPWRTIGGEAEVDAERLADRAAFPLVISGETIGVVYAEHGPTIGLEILTRHASRCLESMTAFRTARALARQHDPARVGSDLGEEDASARRYAKLLVSEIKLYHQNDVAAGCRERDLAARLGGEIARARVLYEQRVPLEVQHRADYFHEELVRTLADGDASLLAAEV
jgi:hypothetical protein